MHAACTRPGQHQLEPGRRIVDGVHGHDSNHRTECRRAQPLSGAGRRRNRLCRPYRCETWPPSGATCATHHRPGDTLPALLAYDTQCRIAGPQGQRWLPLSDVFIGPGRTALVAGEILTELRLPPPLPRSGGLYIKHSPRGAMDISSVGAASVVSLADDGSCVVARIALGAVAPVPMRATAAERSVDRPDSQHRRHSRSGPGGGRNVYTHIRCAQRRRLSSGDGARPHPTNFATRRCHRRTWLPHVHRTAATRC